MKEPVKIVELMKLSGCKDITINNNMIVALDKDNQIHIKGMCTIPSFLSNISRICLKGDLLYMVTIDTTIIILNTLEMALLGVYEGISEKIKQVQFGERRIHIITDTYKYYTTSYENIKLEIVDDTEKAPSNLSIEELEIAKERAIKAPQTKFSLQRVFKNIVVSSKGDDLTFLDTFGNLNYNGKDFLCVSENLKYLYVANSRIFLVIGDNLIAYNLSSMTIEDKREIGGFRIGEGPFIVASSTLISLSTMKQYILQVQVDNLRWINDRLFFFDSESVYEIIFPID
ncbi:hypothetical protein NGRA_0612 [Nosema granulosis]|uniref:Uncharacterized protein n=1 Tax=Nosema granulosis TaxID=83296 RepID=A0A9P6H018_9MICR|nr:hypothetical protein NGRA_0612 [Nosema granulosis]